MCEQCFAKFTEDLGDLVGTRGQAGIRTRLEPFGDALEKTLLPAEIGAVVDLAPLPGTPGSVWLLLPEGGPLIRFDADTLEWAHLAKSCLAPEPKHEPWDNHALKRRLHVSSCGEFAAIVNDYGRFGQVIDLRSGRVTLELDGGDYHPETVPFSIAFATLGGRTRVVHRTSWNRLDFSDPATGELLTARGPTSYGSGEHRPAHYLDYFHGALHVNPGGNRVIDDGWVWHPVGLPVVWSLKRWISENVWESEDGPTRLDVCARSYYWDHAITWLDDDRVAVAGIGDDDTSMLEGARIFDVTKQDGQRPGWGGSRWARELTAFAGPSGSFFSDGSWLFSSDQTGLSRWDPKTGERTGRLPGFQPTHHHRAARELVQLIDQTLVRFAPEKAPT